MFIASPYFHEGLQFLLEKLYESNWFYYVIILWFSFQENSGFKTKLNFS